MGDSVSAGVALNILAQLNQAPAMRGRVASRQVCPMCGARGRYSLVRGRGQSALVCECGRWAATRLEIVIKWRGKTRRITHDERAQRIRTYAEAEAALVEINNQIKRGVFDPSLWSGVRTNKLLWENYLAAWLAREKARTTKSTYSAKRFAAKHLDWFSGMNLRDIRAAHLQDFCNQLPLAPSTQKYIVSVLNQILREAVEREDIERVPRLPRIDVPEKPIAWMGPEEQAQALAAMPEEHRPIFRFLMLYGCRVSEACALCWDAIDRSKGLVYFKRTFSAADEMQETTKTRRARALPIFDEFAAHLDSQPPGMGTAPVFRNPRARTARKFYSRYILGRIWATALQRAKLPHIPLKNGTRHSRGMQAINVEGWDSADAQAMLGHANAGTTNKYYARPEAGRLKRLVDAPVVNLLSTRETSSDDS